MNARLPIDPAMPAQAVPQPDTPRWWQQHVTQVRQWTPTLISFRITRAEGFRFVPGHYARIGLPDAASDAVWRPFSMVSGADDDFLEFLVVLIAGGQFSRRMAALKVGDPVLVEKLSYGFLTVDQLAPGNDLWMLATGTGLGPFMSILRYPAAWRSFDHLVLVHSVRRAEELAYQKDIEAIRDSEATSGVRADLRYLPVVTREKHPGALYARIPQLIINGRLEAAADVPLESGHSRVMVCGNPELGRDMRSLLTVRGFAATRRGVLGQMAFEKYW